MGRDVPAMVFTRDDRRRYRSKMQHCLDAFARMLREEQFEFERPQVGLEIELNLVDATGEPAMRSTEVLDAIADPAWSSELGRFNLEINIPPRTRLTAGGPDSWEQEIRDALNHAEERAAALGAHLMMIGILPTLRQSHVSGAALSENPRYRLLNEQVFAARGEDLRIELDGVDRLRTYADTITPEAACTSTQFHLQVSPDEFPRYWNAAQAIAGVQVALAANSPFLFGNELWRETRIPLFEQATDTRPEEIKVQGVRPRVWFGERWITSVFDLFEENVRYFPALLPLCEKEDPLDKLDSGGVPDLGELTLHNGTIYRWNRPVYAVAGGEPHLRVENRVLPAGPTVADTLANGAFYYGLTRALVEEERPVWSRMSFSAAEENLHTAARHGIDARLYWPGAGEVPAAELVLRRLLPLAHQGLEISGMDAAWREPLLGIIEQRCVTGRNGALWQSEMVHHIEGGGQVDRHEALRRMTLHYMEYMHLNAPAHTWPVD
ncbi:glutamate--cysteine ligase [Streptomyces sp. NPDC006208]|uniref:glutamate--cysteine ligase n=1 Tax=Streptomyces sp. NPDC006208 TaxID=3156734 RepID=UPI0033AFE84A